MILSFTIYSLGQLTALCSPGPAPTPSPSAPAATPPPHLLQHPIHPSAKASIKRHHLPTAFSDSARPLRISLLLNSLSLPRPALWLFTAPLLECKRPGGKAQSHSKFSPPSELCTLPCSQWLFNSISERKELSSRSLDQRWKASHFCSGKYNIYKNNINNREKHGGKSNAWIKTRAHLPTEVPDSPPLVTKIRKCTARGDRWRSQP